MVRIPALASGNFSFIKVSRPTVEPINPSVHCVPGVFLGVKQIGRESVNSPLSNAEFQNEWSSISSPPYAFIACTGATFPSLRY